MELLKAPQLGADHYEMQIDESYFSGTRKYYRERLQTGEIPQKETLRDRQLFAATTKAKEIMVIK